MKIIYGFRGIILELAVRLNSHRLGVISLSLLPIVWRFGLAERLNSHHLGVISLSFLPIVWRNKTLTALPLGV